MSSTMTSSPETKRVAIGRRVWLVAWLLLLVAPDVGSAATASARQGVFTIVHADTKPGVANPDEALYYLRSGRTAIRLLFAKAPSFRPGQQITVRGTLQGNDLAVHTARASGPVVGQTTTGAHSVLIMMVYWTTPDSMTPAQAVSQVGTTDNAWYLGTSYNQLGLSATATPWMAIPDSTQSGTTCNLYQILADGEAAATANGYSPSSYDHEMIYIPIGTPGCNVWAGQGEVNGRITWIYGYMDTRVTTHELGHNLGLWHSHSLTCHDPANPGAYATFSTLCDPYAEYGDTWDSMGNCCFTDTPGQFNAEQKQNLGWMQNRVATAGTGTQTFTIAPLEQAVAALQAVVVPGDQTYWVDYRQAISQDSYLSGYPGVTDGVEVHIPQPASGTNGTDLLDMTPNGSFSDEALPVGHSWASAGGVVITVNSATATGASVTVTVPSPLPGAVSNLSGAYNQSTGTVNLAWTNPSATSTTGAPTGDVVRRGNVNGSCPASSTTGASIGGTSLRISESDPVSGLTAGVYCYSVFATNAGGPGPGATAAVDTRPTTVGSPGAPQYQFYQPSGLTTGSSPTVPEQTVWAASPTPGVTYTLQEQVNGGSWATVLAGTTALGFKTQLVFNNSYAFRVEAVLGSSTSAFAPNSAFTVLPYQDSAVSYTGTWSMGGVSNLWGGSDHYTKAAGASGSFSFTGRNVAVIGNVGAGNGSAKMYIDGVLIKTVSEYASSTKYRQVVARRGWPAPGSHTIKLVNVATSGHPRFDIDGIVVFK